MKTMKTNNWKWAAILMILAAASTVSCSDDNNGDTPEPPEPGETIVIGDGSQDYELQETTLEAKNTYVLKGFVYVPNGVTLTIEPGTVIRGDKDTKATLIVERGGKIMAEGTKEKPIVFTSAQDAGKRKTGDWGGIILLGKAKNNMGEMTIEGGVRSKHGGSDDADNSGVLKYVRCEFAGIEYEPDNEINGITMGSVGSGTTIQYVQVSYCGDDSFEWFGGAVGAKHLVAFRGWDDDFDTDNGFSGKIQYALGLRDPKVGDKSASNGFESDNNSSASTSEPFTSPVFANVSLFGPVADPAAYTNEAGINGSPTDARFQASLHLRRNTQLDIHNSVIAAFPVGLIIENDKGSTTQTWATEGKLNVTNCVMAGMVKNYQDAQYWKEGTQINPDDNGTFAESYFTRGNGGNSAYVSISDLKFTGNPLDLTNPGMYITSDSPLATGADWTGSNVSTGFDKVAYVGAFGPDETASSNWTSGWCNWDPQNTEY